jgi:hypothetical protein
VIGLQFCNYELKPNTFFQLFFKSFLAIKSDTSNWVSDIIKTAKSEQCNLVADLFSMMTEVITNELHIPNLLTRMTSFTVGMYGPDILMPDKVYEPVVDNFIKQFISVMTPISLKDANKSLESIITDHQMIKNLLVNYVDYDKSSKVIRMKADWIDRLKKIKPNFDLLWYNSKEDSKYKQMIETNFPAIDLLESAEPRSDLNKRLRNKLYDSDTMGLAVDLISQMDQTSGLSNLLRCFLKFLLMQLNSFNKNSNDEDSLKAFIDGKLEKLLVFMEKQSGLTTVIDQARSKISLIKQKYLDEKEETTLRIVKSPDTSKAEHNEYIKNLFEKKKGKIMSKMADRKSIFMVGLEKASDRLIQSISKTDDDIQCPFTQEKLTNSKLYFMLGQMHYFNVSYALTLDIEDGRSFYAQYDTQ